MTIRQWGAVLMMALLVAGLSVIGLYVGWFVFEAGKHVAALVLGLIGFVIGAIAAYEEVNA